MPMPTEFWGETPDERARRVAIQQAERAACVNDGAELIDTDDLDEIFAELLRLHRIVGDPRTIELLRRVLPERMENWDNADHHR